ncbi:MAG TPA: ABC transporter substrate-binding protein [Candidatus Dormibacteraeota bacterium]|nr:ABC transporter substrate-binding protein [Candidatus Dormibacteraeota bacterium]
MTKTFRHGGLAAVLLIGLTACGNGTSSVPTTAAGTYTIGFAEAKTGYLALVDQPVEQGMLVTIDQINKNGGIDGKYKISLISEDMKTDAATGATVAQDLLSKNINFLVTTCDADVSLPGATIAVNAKIPVMSSCGADASFPQRVGSLGFLNVPGTQSQGAAMAEYALKQGYKNAYVLLSRDEGYTQTLAQAFEDRFKSGGASIVGEDQYKIGQTDYRVTATKIVNASPKPDVIMTNTFPPDSVAFLKDLERAGNKTPILLVDGNDTGSIFQAGPQLDLSTMFTYGGYRGTGSLVDQFVKQYTDKFGHAPESLQTALGGDLILVLAAAVTKAGSTDGTKVAAALANLENVQGVTGPITYKDRNGLPKKLYAVVKINRNTNQFQVLDNFFPTQIPNPR